jgi:hypothetical protein
MNPRTKESLAVLALDLWGPTRRNHIAWSCTQHRAAKQTYINDPSQEFLAKPGAFCLWNNTV